MARLVLKKLLCILSLGLAATTASSEALDTSAYRQALQVGVESHAYDQLAIGWIDGDERATWFLGGGTKPTITTPFEIGALTEVFTGLLLARAAIDGEVRLRSTLGESLREFPFADSQLGAMPLLDLVTHRAGLPVIPQNLFPSNVDDPYAGYIGADLRIFLANFRTTGESGGGYSPLDLGIVGFALARHFETTLDQAFTEKIFAPLSMTHSGFEDAGLPDGHSHGAVVPHWHFGGLGGAAGLRSSAGDLLDFLQANLRPQGSALRAAILLSRQPQDTKKQSGGLGWNILDIDADGQTWPLIWRASTTAGFSAFMGFRTDRQRALVILGNSDADVSRIGLAWLQELAAPLPPPASEVVDPSFDAAAYAGLYKFDALGGEVIVRDDGSELSAQLQGSPLSPLQKVGDDVFITRGDAMTLSFQRERDKITNVVVARNGVNLLARRLTAQAPHLNRKVISVSPDILSAFVGDYRLDVSTFARVSVDGGGLNLQLTGRASIPIAPFSRDHFTDVDNSCEVTFRRESSGAVSAIVIDLAGVERRGSRETWRLPASGVGY